MFFHFHCIPFIVIGIVSLVFAKKIADFMLSFLPGHKFNKQPYKSLLYIWPIRFIGIIFLGFSFLIFSSGPSTINMNKAKNKIILLEKGEIIEAKVEKCYFQLLASSGWIVVYRFIAKDPKTHKEKTFFGSSQGPKEYYHNLSRGDALDIIYNPENPNINCEIRCFLNHPSYRSTFKKAGKLNLLDKFSEQYKLENYTFKQWYRLQRRN